MPQLGWHLKCNGLIDNKKRPQAAVCDRRRDGLLFLMLLREQQVQRDGGDTAGSNA
ncbi:hypothetical protein SLIQ_24000 [Serratia liquefaciens FK01]|nr:hypothetical protein SLIQ_24000 [Serratia liquefaciens FK01]